MLQLCAHYQKKKTTKCFRDDPEHEVNENTPD